MNLAKTETAAKSIVLNRLLLLLLVAVVWSAGIIGRLVYLQGFKADYYRELAAAQQWGYVEINPRRGDILDRNLEELVVSVPADFIYAHPREITDPHQTAKSLSRVLEVKSGELLEKLTSDKPFVYLKRKVPPHQSKKVRALKIKGVGTREEGKRVYPNRELASNILGFVGLDDEGLGGLEYSYNEVLGGKKQRVDLHFDARRNSYDRVAQPKQTDGNILVLTLDRTIQHAAERALRKTVEEHRARSGVAIVMNPHSGEVMAMASYPTFDPNNVVDSNGSSRRNRAILDVYEPGSTFKTITLAAVLNEDLADLNEVIDCRVGTARLAGKVYHEAKRSFEDLTVAQVFAKSSNVGTVKLGLRLGEDKLYGYVRRFGFGEKTGIELPGEENGLLRPVSQWSRISIGAISIGQEIAVTPIQMVTAIAAIANGGYLVAPHIVKQIMSPKGDVVRRLQATRQQILRPGTVTRMRMAMAAVISDGTGKNTRLDGYSSAGKTGTAQKIVNGVYSKEKYVASFIGFAPVADPALITLVVINEPAGIPYGGYVAGPAFKEIMDRALIQLRVPRDRTVAPDKPPLRMVEANPPTEEQIPERDVSLMEERLLLSNLEATLNHIRQGEVTSDQGNTVTVLLDARVLPDFEGMNLREVAGKCAGQGLRLKIVGHGIAVGQRPAPGKLVSEGTLCEVFFSHEGQETYASPKVALRNSVRLDEELRSRN